MKSTIKAMIEQHPDGPIGPAEDIFTQAIAALCECVQSCTACADACLAEPAEHQAMLRHCIRLNLDCADICLAAARVVTRRTAADGSVIQAQLHAASVACQACADECENHRAQHRHCETNASACRRCQAACNVLLGEISSSGVAAESEEPWTG